MTERKKNVGGVLLERVNTLLLILAAEPKHSELDSAFLAVKEAYERMEGTPVRDTPNFTDKGERLVIPAQPPASPYGDWDVAPIKPVTVDQLDEHGFVKVEEDPSAISKPSGTSGNGDSGAPSGEAVQPESGTVENVPPAAS